MLTGRNRHRVFHARTFDPVLLRDGGRRASLTTTRSHASWKSWKTLNLRDRKIPKLLKSPGESAVLEFGQSHVQVFSSAHVAPSGSQGQRHKTSTLINKVFTCKQHVVYTLLACSRIHFLVFTCKHVVPRTNVTRGGGLTGPGAAGPSGSPVTPEPS